MRSRHSSPAARVQRALDGWRAEARRRAAGCNHQLGRARPVLRRPSHRRRRSNRLALLDDKARHEFVNKHASTNKDIGLAILELPPEFSKVSGTDRERLVEATLEAAHGEKLVELREIEHAVDVANSAVEAGWENQAHEAGVYDLKEWDKQAADIKAAEYIPWLRKSGGEILARPLEGLLSGGSYGVPPATEEEIAKGRYFANKQEWADANGIVLPAKSEAA